MAEKNAIEKIIATCLRSVAASVPVAASFVQVWNDYESHLLAKRIEEFFETVTNEFKRLEEQISRAKEHTLKSGEFPTLLEETIEKIKKEPAKEKRDLFAKLLAGVISIGAEYSFDLKTYFIDTLDSLNANDLEVLSLFFRNSIHQGDDIIDRPGFPHQAENIILSLKKLESLGLIGETDGSNYPNRNKATGYHGSKTSWLNQWRSKYLTILNNGDLFCKMILEKKI
jgi:hypothetical protein